MRSLLSYKTVMLVALFTSAAVSSFGQKDKAKYMGALELAVLNGSFESNIAISTAHGITLGNLTAFAGVGIDHYRYRSVPVYLGVQQTLNAVKLRPFFELAAGYNIAWPTHEQKTAKYFSVWWPGQDTLSFRNGFYAKATAGIILNPRSAVKIGAVAGWSYKSITTSHKEFVFNGTGIVTEWRTSVYRLNRLHTGITVSF